MPSRVKSLLLCLLFCSCQWTRCTASGTAPQPAPQPSGLACPQSWTLSEGVCFKLFKGTKTFSVAEQRCAELPVGQATLAKISSAEQSQAAAALVRNSDVSSAWIGLRMTLQAPGGRRLQGASARLLNEACEDSDVRISSNARGLPEVWKDGSFRPICGHWFWNTNNGATAVCQKLGYTSGQVHQVREAYQEDAYEIRTWQTDEPGLTGGCSAGNPVSIAVSCSGGGSTKLSSCTAEDCYKSKSKYLPVDMSGQGRTVEDSAAACQKRCASVNACAHFSWWSNGGCHIQDSDASLVTENTATAGPPTCNQAGSQKLTWTDGSELAFVASSYSPLHPGQECAMMNISKNLEGAWSPSHCDVARPFLCSMPAQEVDALNMSNMTEASDGTSTTTTKRSASSTAMDSDGTSQGPDVTLTTPQISADTPEDSDATPTTTELSAGTAEDSDATPTTTETSTGTPVDSDATPTTTETSTGTPKDSDATPRNATDNPIGKIAARVEEEGANLRKQLLSSNQTEPLTVSTEGATISVQKLDTSLVSDNTKSIPVAVENTTAEVLVPVSLLKTFGKPVVLQVTAFEDAPKAAEGDQDVRGMVSVNLFDLAGGSLKVNGLKDEIVIKLPVNATEGRVCAYWDENQSNWSSEGLSQESSSPGSALVCRTSHLTLFGGIARGFVRAMECSQGHLFSEVGFRELLNGTWYQHTAVVIIWCLLGFILLMLSVACYLDVHRAEDGVWDDSVFIVFTVSAFPATPTSLAETLAEAAGGVCCIGRCYARIKACLNEYVWPIFDPLFQEIVGNLGDACSLMVDFMGAFRELLLEEEEEAEEDDGSEVAEDEPRRRCLCWFRCRFCCRLSLGWRALLNGGLTKALLTVVKLRASTRLMMSVDDVQLLFEKTAAEAEKKKALSFQGDDVVTIESNSPVDKPMERQQTKRELILSRKEERLRNTLPSVLTDCRSCQSLPRTLWQIFVAKNPWLSVLHSSISQPAVLSVLLSASLWLGDMAIIALFFSTDPNSSVSKRSNRSSKCTNDGFFEEFGALIAVSLWSSLASMVPCWILGTLHRRQFIEFDMEDSDAYHRQIRIWRRRDRVLFVVSILYCATCLLFVLTFHANVTEADGIKWMYSVLFSVGSEFLVVPLVMALLLGLSAHLAARRRTIMQQAVVKLCCEGQQENSEKEMAIKDSPHQQDALVGMSVDGESVRLDLKKEEPPAPIALELPGALPDAEGGVIDRSGDAEATAVEMASNPDALLEKTVDAGTLEVEEARSDSLQDVTDRAGDAAVSLQSAREFIAGEAPPNPESLLEKTVEATDIDHADSLDVEEVHGLEEVRDLTGDAAVSLQSAREVIAGEAPPDPESLLEKTVDAIDTDHDGSLDVEEVHKALQQSAQWSNMTEEEKDTVRASFALIDTDSSGNIELHELQTALQALGIDEAQAEMIFHETDINKNGQINLTEFLALVT